MSDEPAKVPTDEQRLRNLANATQDIRTLLETPRSHDFEGRMWRATYFLDGFLRMATLSQVEDKDGFGAFVRVRHDFPIAKEAIGGPYVTPEDLAIWLGLDMVPEGKVAWKQDKKHTHSKQAEIIVPLRNPQFMLPQG